MYDVKGEDINGEQGEGQGEQVEVSVVPLAHTVTHPWAVVIKTVCEKKSQTHKMYQRLHTNIFRKQTLLEIKQELKIHQCQLQAFSPRQICAIASENLQSKYRDHFPSLCLSSSDTWRRVKIKQGRVKQTTEVNI